MKQNYKVIWANVAESDLKDIIEYISIDSPQNALRILKNIKQKTSELYTLPERNRIVPELQDQGILQYREMIIPPWRLIYRIAERKVYVLSLIDSRRNVEDILLKRLIATK
ncbi:MAG: plasmid stabilization protein [Deltaproteobacteria bacterium]|nr:MAG: plasmid stabilization protein [Deltaproteobacteria bacterium]